MPIPTTEERIGTMISDRYRLEEILGQGGMGVVYGGSHTWTGRGVAVKILKADVATESDAVRRFLQEARSTAAIEHPNVIDVLDMGSEEDGTVFMVLERLEGQTLGERLKEAGRLEVAETLEVMLPVLLGLDSAHAAGVLHRDVKPDNIFVSMDGAGRLVPKVLDFGMSKVLEAGLGTTDSGTLLGTPYYMAPEQAEGSPDVGPSVDVWACGAVLYHCLAGERAFDGSSRPAILLQIARGTFTPLSEVAPHVPAALAEAVDRALASDLEERWPSIRALALALRAAAHGAGLALSTDAFADDESPAPVAPPPRRPRAWLVGAVVALVLGVGLAAWVASAPADRAPDGPEPPRQTVVEPVAERDFAAPPDPAPDPAPEPPPAPAAPEVEVVTAPPGAEVVVDGAVRCETPCALSTEAPLRATLHLRGHRARALDLAAGQTGTLEVALRPQHRRPPPVEVPALPETPF